MKRMSRWCFVFGYVAMLGLLIGCNNSASDNDISKQTTQNVKSTTFNYDDFEKKQEWKYGVLLGDNQIASFDTPLYYTDLKLGVSRPLCSVQDCEHNNPDVCQAIFDSHYGCDFVYCYNDKIYAASVLSNTIRIKCGTAYEKNHETVAYEVFAGDVDLREYYVYGDYLYIAVSVEDTEKEHLQDDEDESYMVYYQPCIYEFNFATGELSLLYKDEKGGYGSGIGDLYAFDNVLYFDDGTEDGKLGALDIVTKEMSKVEGYDAGEYLGCHGNNNYYAKTDEHGYQTGDVYIWNMTEQKEEVIRLTDLPKDENRQCYIHLLEEGFVVNDLLLEDENDIETGTMTFYDMEGKQTDVVEDCSMYVIGEHQGFYLLSDLTYAEVAFAYAAKEDVKLSNSKERNRRVIYLYK